MRRHLLWLARLLSAAGIFNLCAVSTAARRVPTAASGARRLARSGTMDATLASRYFGEARELCRRDGGRLWGASLCGPMMFADAETRAVFASEPDGEGLLRPSGEVFVGTLPPTVNIANTSIEWAGAHWMLIKSSALSGDSYRRATMMMHELWHRRQGELGFPASGATNNHLDTRDGRLWLQLEWRALASALAVRGRARRRAVDDALLFRAQRRSLSPSAASEEREMEMHEGLAEYTGVRLSGNPNPARYVVGVNLKEAAQRESFVRSFAYASGPAYGLLLDEAAPGWTRKLRKGDDLGAVLQGRLRLRPARNLRRAAEDRSRIYEGEKLAASESERENRRRQLIADYRARLVEGPVLIIPLQNMRMSFDPGGLVPLDTLGTVYPQIRVVDVWGILTVVSGGALMSGSFSDITVQAPAATGQRPLRGDGWTLELKEGWQLAPYRRIGDFVVRKVL